MYLKTQLRIEGGAFDPIIVWKEVQDKNHKKITLLTMYMFVCDNNDAGDDEYDEDSDRDDNRSDLYVKLVSLENIIRLPTPPVHHCPGGGIPVTRVSNRLWVVVFDK